jgi:hypothetical protein
MDLNDIQACVAVGRAPSFSAAGRGVRVPTYNLAFLPRFAAMSEEEFQAFAESKPLRKEFMGPQGLLAERDERRNAAAAPHI